MNRKGKATQSRGEMSADDEAEQGWKPDRYAEHAPFVPLLGQSVLDLLIPALCHGEGHRSVDSVRLRFLARAG
jgi:hypothetical protein